MEEYPVPVLKNAPIIEALIDIRVKLPSMIVDASFFDPLYDKIKSRYSERQEQKVSLFSIEPTSRDNPLRALQPKINGYRFVSSDKKNIMLAQLDGFTLSMLQPYTQWQDLRDEAIKLWHFYKEVAKPEAITRVALRYINNLNIPLPIDNFGEYLTAPPIVPPELPQGISSFLTRVVVTEPSLGINAIITQALELVPPMQEITRLPVILDIDVFNQDPKGMTETDAWNTIEQLRHFKNKIFDKSITPRLKETYE